MTTKAYSYLRFSTPDQAKGDSFRRQSERARAYADEHGLDLDDSLSFHDLGVSAFHGANAETGALGDFLEAVKTGLVDRGSYLLVESLDRISRNVPLVALNVLQSILLNGVKVVTLIDRRCYDADSLRNDSFSLIMSLLTFIRSHDESETKSKRLKSSWDNKRKNIATKPLTAKIPAWLTIVDGKIEAIDDRAALVKQIYDDYLKGQGPETIARKLNTDGVKPWGRGAMWHKSYIVKILSNPGVCGVFVPHTLEHDGLKKNRIALDAIENYYPAVIDEITFTAAQNQRKQKGIKGRKTGTKLTNIVSKLAKCPKCNISMVKVNKGGSFQYLVCSRAKIGGYCEYNSIRYHDFEKAFIRSLKAKFSVPSDSNSIASIEAAIERNNATIGKCIEENRNLVDAIKSGAMKGNTVIYDSVPVPVKVDEMYITENVPWTVADDLKKNEWLIDLLKKEKAALERQLNTIRPAAVEQKADKLKAALVGGDIAEINAALRGLCRSVVIGSDSVEMHFHHTDRVLSLPLA